MTLPCPALPCSALPCPALPCHRETDGDCQLHFALRASDVSAQHAVRATLPFSAWDRSIHGHPPLSLAQQSEQLRVFELPRGFSRLLVRWARRRQTTTSRQPRDRCASSWFISNFVSWKHCWTELEPLVPAGSRETGRQTTGRSDTVGKSPILAQPQS
ncbi:hypothetical protein BKA80DRAFT_254645 [Phyllosticta citrichinensis]